MTVLTIMLKRESFGLKIEQRETSWNLKLDNRVPIDWLMLMRITRYAKLNSNILWGSVKAVIPITQLQVLVKVVN